MLVCWAISLLCIILYTIFVIATTVMLSAIWFPQTHPTPLGNKLKRIYRIFVPNRGFFVFFQILPIVPAIFPYLLQWFSKNVYDPWMRVYYYGVPDWIIVFLLSAASITLFLTSLSAQKAHRMDLFRIYKIENNKEKKAP